MAAKAAVKKSPYGWRYQQARKRLLSGGDLCWRGCGRRAVEADHDPPLALHEHREGSGCCELKPSCAECQRKQGHELQREVRRGAVVELEVVEEPDGIPAGDGVWDVGWLADLRDVPGDAVWPRLMSAPHPQAVASLGVEFEEWVAGRTGRELRWFQRLFVRRLLEVDADDALVWETALLTVARQVGKSWLLRELIMWRMHQGPLFGEAQHVVLISMMKNQARDVFDPELAWVKDQGRDFYTWREVNSEEEISLVADGSRWALASKGGNRTGGAYGKSTSLGVVDEGWAVRAFTVDEALEPSLVAMEQSQLLLVSTAHRMATSLMLDRRTAALAALADPVDGDLIVEWSPLRDCELEDRTAWRQASPYWTVRRERSIARAVTRALSGYVTDDKAEPDPIEAVRSQWLNIWPHKLTTAAGEMLVAPDVWTRLRMSPQREPVRLWVAVEDNYGDGAGVAVVGDLGDDTFEVDAWLCDDRDQALTSAQELVAARPVPSTLLVSPSLYTQRGQAMSAADTRFGLPQLRTFVAQGRVVHDDTPELDVQLLEVRVRQMPGGGLSIAPGVRADLVRALVWALRAAASPQRRPAIH